ncbi:MAG: DUF4338 domain-containing protein [Gammaproteobacteria bacterium]
MSDRHHTFPSFCGAEVSREQQSMILQIIERYGRLTRTELASTLCELLDWTRPNGKLKTVECRQFLEQLEHMGLLQLPKKQRRSPRQTKTIAFTEASESHHVVQGALADFRPITLTVVESADDRALWKELIERHHYLGYRTPFGAHLRYFIQATRPERTIIGCLQFSSPAWRMAPRDQWIGWTDEVRAQRLQHIINNSRFLVLPHVRLPNLASHALSLAMRRVVHDWQARYHIKPLLIETLVDTQKFTGGCYRAANWIDVGITCGRGRQDSRHERHNANPKRIFLLPLDRKVRERLQCAVSPSKEKLSHKQAEALALR